MSLEKPKKLVCPACGKSPSARPCGATHVVLRAGLSKARNGKKTPARRKARKIGMKQCDALWSKLVRKAGKCHLAGTDGLECKGYLQAAHGFSRIYRGTRWNLQNGFCLCAAHHLFYTYRPLEWNIVLYKEWRKDGYHRLHDLAIATGQKVDYDAVYASLKAADREIAVAA